MAWGQAESDTLILKNGSMYSGKFLGFRSGKIMFETTNNSPLKPPVKSLQKLSTNAFMIINNGQWIITKEFVKSYLGNINQQSFNNYQQNYQQGLAAAQTDFVVSQRLYGILPPDKSLQQWSGPRWYSKDLTDTRPPGFRNAYKREMTKLKFKQDVKFLSVAGCGFLGMWSWLLANWSH